MRGLYGAQEQIGRVIDLRLRDLHRISRREEMYWARSKKASIEGCLRAEVDLLYLEDAKDVNLWAPE